MTAISRRSSSKERNLIFSTRSAARRRRFEILAGLTVFFAFPAFTLFLGFRFFIAYNEPSPLPAAVNSWRGGPLLPHESRRFNRSRIAQREFYTICILSNLQLPPATWW